MGFEIVRDRIEIEICAENVGDEIEVFVKRGDKFKTGFFDNTTQCSLNRLEAFAERMNQRGFYVAGARHKDNMRFCITLDMGGR